MLGPQGVVVAKRAGLRVLADVADHIDLPFVEEPPTTKTIERQTRRAQKVFAASLRGIRYTVDAGNAQKSSA